MKRLLLICLLFFVPVNLYADDVGGNITSGVTWFKANSPYHVTSRINVLNNAILSIEAGVEIYFNSSTGITITEGQLVAIGTQADKILFSAETGTSWEGLRFNNYSVDAVLDAYGNYIEGSVLKECIIEKVLGSAIYCEYANPLIERNTIQNNINTSGVSSDNIITFDRCEDIKLVKNLFTENEESSSLIGGIWSSGIISSNEFFANSITRRVMNINSGIVTIEKNIFSDNNYALYLSINTTTNFTIRYNNFDNGGILNCNPEELDATLNWWGTTAIDEINTKIFDYYENSSYGRVIYQPFLSQPYVNEEVQPPTAKAGPDQIVFDTITFDGSGSSDPDGAPLMYEWQIQHTTDLSISYLLEEENVTLSDLPTGFYNVTLTVTDSEGASATDDMFFSATGQKGDFDFDGDVDGEDLATFAEEFGL